MCMRVWVQRRACQASHGLNAATGTRAYTGSGTCLTRFLDRQKPPCTPTPVCLQLVLPATLRQWRVLSSVCSRAVLHAARCSPWRGASGP